MNNLRKNYKIKATAEEVFNALTNPFTIELWSGYPAKMTIGENTEFELWDGDIAGINLEIVKDKKLVQEWYFGDQPEKSIVTITLSRKGNSTLVELEHTNIPESEFNDIRNGWDQHYWGAIQEFFK